ncbi:FecR family protein [Daejeonella lutea]|uniref:FecR family protein n=1 Tax=Daejeonella lutea TaxID=572036 RepID=A0A1T5ESP0_9SPHI|nr:FecR family protein [Daejeonella lutea]SKB86955.1 FecR family protein [Daejeonella lutea]
MDNKEFKILVDKYLSGTASPEEEEYLLNYYDSFQENEISWDEDKMGIREEVKSKLYTRALNKISEVERSGMRRTKYLMKWSLAAAVIMIVSVAVYFYSLQADPVPVLAAKKEKPVLNDILPGGNKAILTLADGTQIILDNAADGTLTTQGNISVNKNKDGQLIYKVNNGASESAKVLEFNTIRTPASGQYQVVLSDETKVWLNAGSSIKFPTAFTANERLVEIEGEAYFEVAKDRKRPFRVKSDNQLIEVLGTHFNVNAYRDESLVKTTVVEGSVKISSGTENNTIKPGQQNRLSRTKGNMHIAEVDLEEAISWKNGLFMFDNEEIHSIMRKISRWYGVEVVYQDRDIEEKFGGTVSRFENVSQVLKILEVTGTIHFKIVQGDDSGKGRRIIVMK